jgi:hypothetical protein
MKLIKLTEIQKKSGDIVEIPVLLNPEAIAAVIQDTDDFVKGAIHIFGENNEHRVISLIQLRTQQKMAVKESLDEIMGLVNCESLCDAEPIQNLKVT